MSKFRHLEFMYIALKVTISKMSKDSIIVNLPIKDH